MKLSQKFCEQCKRQFISRERRVWEDNHPFCKTCRPNTVIARIGFSIEPDDDSTKFVEPNACVKVLQQCAVGLVCAKITYQKPGEEWVTERIVEPYSLRYANSGIIVETWQRTPTIDDPSWRSFRTDRIKSAMPTTELFTPRAPVTLQTGEAKRFDINERPGTNTEIPSPEQLYSECLRESLDDMTITDVEAAELAGLRKSLHIEQIRAIHGRAYASMLAEVCADGRVTSDEIEKLVAMRVWLNELGWAP